MSDEAVRRWRVPIAVPVAKFVVAGVLVVAVVTIARDLVGAVLGLLVAGGLSLSGLRDVLVPVRLEADAEGVTVLSGLSGRRRYPWAVIDRIRVDRRRRLLGRSTMLEIDVDDDLYFLTQYELGAPPAEVAEELATFRTGR
ncbi:PH domain-containing protein [Cryptosporangium aurantiacum]|uniref:PH domain-containing protein n=1 Tax=Cryptosporangium aurantiacum TaxID=134849 RepID=UPI0009323C4F|nr:PH domain-containing protein [Cryptosporangium aurantiacum]